MKTIELIEKTAQKIDLLAKINRDDKSNVGNNNSNNKNGKHSFGNKKKPTVNFADAKQARKTIEVKVSQIDLSIQKPKIAPSNPVFRYLSLKKKQANPKVNHHAKKQPEVKIEPDFTITFNPKNANVRCSVRQKQIFDWAFKKITYKDLNLEHLLNSNESKPKQLHKIWFDENDEIYRSPSINDHINLAAYDDPDEDAEFYRKHLQSIAASKSESNKNSTYTKELNNKLVELSKERFKILTMLDYQKEVFVRRQLIKSESLPGLRCIALLKQNKTYKFRNPVKFLSLSQNLEDKEDKEEEEEEEDNTDDDKLTNLIHKKLSSAPMIMNNKNKQIKSSSKDNKIRPNTTNLILKSSKIRKNKSDKHKFRFVDEEEEEEEQEDEEDEDEYRNDRINKAESSISSSQSKNNTETKLKKKSILKNSKYRFEETSDTNNNHSNQSDTCFKMVSSDSPNPSLYFNSTRKLKQETYSDSLNSDPLNDFKQDLSLFNYSSSNSNRATAATSAISNNLSKLNEKFLPKNNNNNKESTVSFKFASDYLINKNDMKNMQHNQQQQQQQKNKRISSKLKISLSKTSRKNENNVSMSLSSSSGRKSDKQILFKENYFKKNELRSSQPPPPPAASQKNNLKIIDLSINSINNSASNSRLSYSNNKNFYSNNNSSSDNEYKKTINKQSKNGNLNDSSLMLTSSAGAFTTRDDDSPIADKRFVDLINLVKPSHFVKEMRDVAKIVERNDALQAISMDKDARDRMSRVRETGSKLAMRAKQTIDLGDYDYNN